jgi:pimeloyl-ACP methyl ester carboxylesterase
MLEHVPVLAIRGETSDILSPETFARMRAIKPDLRTLTVARRGHAPTLDEPESRVAIRGFLESLA